MAEKSPIHFNLSTGGFRIARPGYDAATATGANLVLDSDENAWPVIVKAGQVTGTVEHMNYLHVTNGSWNSGIIVPYGTTYAEAPYVIVSPVGTVASVSLWNPNEGNPYLSYNCSGMDFQVIEYQDKFQIVRPLFHDWVTQYSGSAPAASRTFNYVCILPPSAASTPSSGEHVRTRFHFDSSNFHFAVAKAGKSIDSTDPQDFAFHSTLHAENARVVASGSFETRYGAAEWGQTRTLTYTYPRAINRTPRFTMFHETYQTNIPVGDPPPPFYYYTSDPVLYGGVADTEKVQKSITMYSAYGDTVYRARFWVFA